MCAHRAVILCSGKKLSELMILGAMWSQTKNEDPYHFSFLCILYQCTYASTRSREVQVLELVSNSRDGLAVVKEILVLRKYCISPMT